MSTDIRAFFGELAERHVVCTGCGVRFRPMLGQLFSPADGENRYCSRDCRRASESPPDHPCQACGAVRSGASRVFGQLDICRDCRDVAWSTCWRKIVSWHERAPMEYGGYQLNPYRCKLCHGWHHTKSDSTELTNVAFAARIDQLAALIRSRNFVIDAFRNREHSQFQEQS